MQKKKIPPLTVNGLADSLGQDRRTIRKRLVEAGLFPPEKHPTEKVFSALKPADSGGSIKDRLQFEQWRKLKLANDVKEGKLQDAQKLGQWIGSILGASREILEQKLINEYPALVENLDAPQIRIRSKKLFDDILDHLRPLGEKFAA